MPRSLHVPALLKQPFPSGPRVRKIARGPARGLRFTIDFDHQLRFFLGMYETELTPWLERFATPGTVAYDVGADVGYQALVIARLTNAPVVAFEPRDEAAAQLERHHQLNRDRIGPVQVVRARVSRNSTTGTTSLDDFRARSPLDPPGLLLVDVDGAELEVLQGAARLFDDVKPHVVIETHSRSLERGCMAILTAASYRPVIVNARRMFGDYRPIAHNRWVVAEGRPAYAGAASRKNLSASTSAPSS